MWKTPDQKPDGEDTYIAITTDGLICDFVSPKMCDNSVDRWAYLTDIIAQADKAERLQKGLENVYKLFLDMANFTAGATPNKYIQDIFNEIKQLIKGE